MFTTTDLTIGARVLLGGSVATIVGTGTIHRAGVPTPAVLVTCPDYGPGIATIAGNDLYKVGPRV